MNRFLDDFAVPIGISIGVLATAWGLAWVTNIQSQLLQ